MGYDIPMSETIDKKSSIIGNAAANLITVSEETAGMGYDPVARQRLINAMDLCVMVCEDKMGRTSGVERFRRIVKESEERMRSK